MDISVKIKNFRCFADDAHGFECLKPVNLIIGRNNSGKSSLLDAIGLLTQKDAKIEGGDIRVGASKGEIIIEGVVVEAMIGRAFSQNTSGGDIQGNHYKFGTRFIGAKISRSVLEQQPFRGIAGDGLPQCPKNYLDKLALALTNPLQGKLFRRISAERNIQPESDAGKSMDIKDNGVGATNIIKNFITQATYPSELVERDILNDLNEIFGEEGVFTAIACRQLENGWWEIFLSEEHKGRINLSRSGSGLKTVILVLLYIRLLPVIHKKPLSDFIFSFEELENNLHPALLRRLLNYVRKVATRDGAMFFLTTHSSVSIDLFSRDREAQIIHVSHDGQKAVTRTTRTYVEHVGVLDDLDVRASDLLQSNGVIWVEGPSDRIYINRWIDLWSEGALKEGVHYQCVFYGGRLLSHLMVGDAEGQAGVDILKVNRNSVIVIDSDKRSAEQGINATKTRIIGEIESVGGIAWLTAGREIENYLPIEVVKAWLQEGANAAQQVGDFTDFFEWLEEIRPDLGKSMVKQKPLLAERLVPHMSREGFNGILDLDERMREVCSQIRRWNGL
jgi:predicted ATPase